MIDIKEKIIKRKKKFVKNFVYTNDFKDFYYVDSYFLPLLLLSYDYIDELYFILNKEGFNKYVNKSDYYDITLLHIAVKKGNLELIDKLISLGADINAKTCNGLSVAYEAIMQMNVIVLKKLISFGYMFTESDLYILSLSKNTDLKKIIETFKFDNNVIPLDLERRVA